MIDRITNDTHNIRNCKDTSDPILIEVLLYNSSVQSFTASSGAWLNADVHSEIFSNALVAAFLLANTSVKIATYSINHCFCTPCIISNSIKVS